MVPSLIMECGEHQRMSQVCYMVTPSTGHGHGKAWDEWCALAGDRRVDVDRAVKFRVTLEYLLQLRDQGWSAVVAQWRLAGVSFHFLPRR